LFLFVKQGILAALIKDFTFKKKGEAFIPCYAYHTFDKNFRPFKKLCPIKKTYLSNPIKKFYKNKIFVKFFIMCLRLTFFLEMSTKEAKPICAYPFPFAQGFFHPVGVKGNNLGSGPSYARFF
jgi:hypothetical protein